MEMVLSRTQSQRYEVNISRGKGCGRFWPRTLYRFEFGRGCKVQSLMTIERESRMSNHIIDCPECGHFHPLNDMCLPKDERCLKHPNIVLYQGHCFVCGSEKDKAQLAAAGNVTHVDTCKDCGVESS